jgi:methylphosphotriester-DNA--protein-cysteine methyltransferase
MNPSCPVRIPIKQTITLFALATTSPGHRFRPTKTVDSTVRQQDK